MQLGLSATNLLKKANNALPVLIGSGGSLTSLSILRSFGIEKIPVICLLDKKFSLSRFSRYCSSVDYFPENDFNYLLKLLVDIGKVSEHKNIIYCENDVYSLFIDKNREELAPLYHLILPTQPLGNLINKQEMVRLAEKSGIDIPQTLFSGEDAIEKIKREISYPCFVKPTFTQPRIRTKGEIVYNEHALEDAISKERFKDGYIVQEIIQGPENNIWMYAGYIGKNIAAHFTGHKIRQVPRNFGITTLGISEENKEIINLSDRLFKECGYKGFFDIEFKKDIKDEKYKFIEINSRICAFNQLGVSSGINLPYIAYNDLSGRKNVINQQRDGVLWISIVDDFITCVKYYSKDNKYILFDWFKNTFKADSYADFNSKDIAPFVWEICNHLLRLHR
jgi:predicted ATP-grasp superfamily ATP-dependent carboligase